MKPGSNQACSWIHGFLPNHVFSGWGAAPLGVLLLAGGCSKAPDAAQQRTELPRVEMESRSAVMRTEYAARANAVGSNRSSVAALGKLAVFLHANDQLA